jgi:hypothetical protein
MDKEWIDEKNFLLIFSAKEREMLLRVNWRFFGPILNLEGWKDAVNYSCHVADSELAVKLFEVAITDAALLDIYRKEELMKRYIYIWSIGDSLK